MANIIKTRTLTAVENHCKKTLFVIEMRDGSRWYTTKGGHVALRTDDPIKSGTNIANLRDWDDFSYYGHTEKCEGIDTMQKFIELVNE